MAINKIYLYADIDFPDFSFKNLQKKYKFVKFGNNVLIGQNAKIDKNTLIGSNTIIEHGVTIGKIA